MNVSNISVILTHETTIIRLRKYIVQKKIREERVILLIFEDPIGC